MTKAIAQMSVLGAAAVALLLLSGAGPNGCEYQDSIEEPRPLKAIFGGAPTYYEDWKATIGLRGGSLDVCSGALIHPEIAISAGHCVYWPEKGRDLRTSPEVLGIYGGASISSSSSNRILHSVSQEIVIHPDWSGMVGDPGTVDMSITHLESPVTAIDPYDGVRGQTLTAGEKAVIAGYGRDASGAYYIHRWGPTTILSIGDYAGTGRPLIEVGNPTGLCTGDSGTSLLTDVDCDGTYESSAVFSAIKGGSSNCSAMANGLMVNSPNYRDWIVSNVKTMTGDDLPDPDTGPGCSSDSDVDADSDADSDVDSDSDGDNDGDDDDDDDNDNDDNDDNPGRTTKDVQCACDSAGARSSRSSIIEKLLNWSFLKK